MKQSPRITTLVLWANQMYLIASDNKLSLISSVSSVYSNLNVLLLMKNTKHKAGLIL